ncbi:unnamed protein product [Cuscuta epithymum]|uniref:Uncharacterized protein n=2 Tax=Cuscuta epithymum TaxID=186058 RepID=A0AAV0EDC4_9ASTE|nr:unnamed protein product [Cuscuta epithymum]
MCIDYGADKPYERNGKPSKLKVIVLESNG